MCVCVCTNVGGYFLIPLHEQDTTEGQFLYDV